MEQAPPYTFGKQNPEYVPDQSIHQSQPGYPLEQIQPAPQPVSIIQPTGNSSTTVVVPVSKKNSISSKSIYNDYMKLNLVYCIQYTCRIQIKE